MSLPRRLSLLLTFSLGFTVLVACSKDKPPADQGPQLGEPIGAEIQGRTNMPALSLALAVSQGQDPVPILPKVVTAVANAVKDCPEFSKDDDKENVTAFAFASGADGKIKVTPRSNERPGVKCVATALDGKDIGTTAALEGRIELKLSSVATK